jgi:hypothetical protein
MLGNNADPKEITDPHFSADLLAKFEIHSHRLTTEGADP